VPNKCGVVNSIDEIEVLRDHFERCGLIAQVEEGISPGLLKVKYKLFSTPLISIIIPNHEHAEDLRRCIDSIMSLSSYSHFEIIIVENNSKSAEVFELYKKLQERDGRIRVLTCPQEIFNFSEINNFATRKAKGDFLLFLNNDTQVINPDWLERMLEFAQRQDVGAVGAKLLYPSMLIQHAGIIIGMGIGAGHYFVDLPKDDIGYGNNLVVPQNLSAVTAACIMVRKTVFDEVNGFDPEYQLGFGDIDFCLKLRQRDFLIVWTPYVELLHFESLTRGYEDDEQKRMRFFREANLMMSRWAEIIKNGDPYYNPNLSLSRVDFSIMANKCNTNPRASKGVFFNRNKAIRI